MQRVTRCHEDSKGNRTNRVIGVRYLVGACHRLAQMLVRRTDVVKEVTIVSRGMEQSFSVNVQAWVTRGE